jgi:serine protease Do
MRGQVRRLRFVLAAGLFAGAAALAGSNTTPEGAEEEPFTFSTFRTIAKKQLPCVVSVVTDVVLEEPQEDFPLFRFYRDAPNHPEMHTKGTGSGVIVSADGYIFTNYHVIEGVEAGKGVEVVLADDTSLDAKIVGKDPQLDIALLKVEPGRELQVALLGDSEQVQIGDWVLAIGSPYGLSHSVSAGIISALGRDIHNGAYDSFIQTDAAINRGNSGGPLFNLRGEVIGINTAIMSASGGSNGIGFAIPINQVREIFDDLKSHGEVVRGWLGVDIQDLSKQNLTDLGLDKTSGSLVTGVWDDSPARKAGLMMNDVIVRFGSLEVQNTRSLLVAVARTKIGTVVPVDVVRKGQNVHLEVTIAERPGELKLAAHSLDPSSVVRPRGLGASFQVLDDELREKYGLQDESGFVVTEVQPKSAAEAAGLQVGDLLLEINRKRINTAEDLLKGVDGSKTALLLVRRGAKSVFLSIDASALKPDPEVKQN